MADVFISYARANEAAAKRVANALSASGLEVWWDEHLPAHRAYSEVIEQRLRDAKAVVVLWSKDAALSQWVRAEADFARTNRKLVQGQLDGELPPMPFNQVQCANLKGWRGQAAHAGFAKLLASVRSLLSGEESEAPAAAASTRWWRQRRLQAAAAAAVLLLVAGAFLLSRILSGGSEERPILAVLPFDSLDQRDSSLVAGIWEDTRQAISRNPQILVLGPNTAEELAERGTDATRRAADYVLEASVRSVGDRIRVNTNLVRTEDGSQLWSENFDRRLDDVFELQSEIAHEIEGRIRGRLARHGGVRPEHIATSGEVYALYSDARARFRRREMGPEFGKLSGQFQRVVEMDPNFAPGWATLAVSKAFFFEGRDTTGAEADARRAIALAPNLAAGHAALGFVLRRGPAAEASLRRAVELDPNDYEALNWLAGSLDEDRAEEKLKLYSRIIEIEPLWWPAVLNKLNVLKKIGSIDAVEDEIKRLGRLGDERMSMALKISLADERGDLSQAIALGVDYYRRASPPDRQFIANFLLSPLFRIGMPEVADNLLTPPSDFVPYIRKNDPKALDMIEAQKSPRDFWTFGPLPIVAARVYLLNGQGPRLAKRYRAVASSPEQFETLVGPALADIAPGAALALRSAGEEQEAKQLLQLAQSAAEEYPVLPLDQEVRLARIYAVQGRKDEAIARLSSAVRQGWLPPYLPIHTDIALDPPLAELKSDPRFEPIRQQILRHIAKERVELGPVRLDPPAKVAA